MDIVKYKLIDTKDGKKELVKIIENKIFKKGLWFDIDNVSIVVKNCKIG